MDLAPTLVRASSSNFADFDPRAVTDAVAALAPLGKDGALAALDGFLAGRNLDADGHEGLFLVLRVLFDVDGDGRHPPLALGGSMPEPPADPATIPRFPILELDGVPLMLVSGYVLGGEAEPLSSHLDFYRKRGVIRAPSAARAGADRSTAYVDAYRRAYGREPTAGERAFIAAQLARAAASPDASAAP